MINISKLYCGMAGESDHLRYSATNPSGPVMVYNCTSRCNLRCIHCYSSSGATCSDNELDTAEAKKLLKEFAQYNCPVVLFSGGEPLLREDLFELLGEAKQLGLRSVISTNGTLINAAFAEKLAGCNVAYVGISMDGTEQFHDRFRKVDGSFKSAVNGIENCKNAGLKTELRFTITKQNESEIPAIFEIAASTGVRRICFYHLIRAGRAKVFEGQVRRVIDTIIKRTDNFVRGWLLDEVLTVDNHADGPYLLLKLMRENGDKFEAAKKLLLINGGNKTGEKIGCVGWDGSVYPDQFWRNYSLGNVREKSFKKIWENDKDPVMNKLRHKNTFADCRCLKCKWFDLCKGNYRFLDTDPGEQNWVNEPACYLTDEEIGISGN